MWNAKNIPLLLAIFGLAACDEGAGDPVGPPDDPLAVALVSGNGQVGKAGESLSKRLVVRVTDTRGHGVADVPVSWRVTSGGGIASLFGECAPTDTHPVATTYTDPEGLTDVSFCPTRLGRSAITATVDAMVGEPATFTANATVVVLSNATWGLFQWPDDPGLEVRVGDVVEWLNWYDVTVEIASASAPPGGASFNAVLDEGERFQFRPGTSGRWGWEYRYRDIETGNLIHNSGGSGRLVVYPGG